MDVDDVDAVDEDHLVHLHQVEPFPKPIFSHPLATVLHKLLVMNPHSGCCFEGIEDAWSKG